MTFIFLLLILTAILFTSVLLYGWSVTDNLSKGNLTEFISVIIPVRNEEGNISEILSDLEIQNIGVANFEVVVVNDHSTDGTQELLNSICESSTLKLKVLENRGSGKKQALKHGINEASGQIIVTTDGDCRVGVNWLREISDWMSNPDTNMLVGPVVQGADGSVLGHFQALEFAALQTTTKACISLGFPTMCNGANLAFRRIIFERVGGYEDNIGIPTGDDEFLMHKIWHDNPGSVKYLKNRNALVTTDVQGSFGQMWNQKLRWAAKWRDYHHSSPKFIALLVFMLNANILFGWLLLFTGILPYRELAMALIIKAIVDYAVITRFTTFFKIKTSVLFFAISEIVYPFYAVSVAVLSLRRVYRWKDRLSYA